MELTQGAVDRRLVVAEYGAEAAEMSMVAPEGVFNGAQLIRAKALGPLGAWPLIQSQGPWP